MSERLDSDSSGVPESADAGFNITIDRYPFWQPLIDEAVYREVNQLDLAAAIINLGVKLTQLEEYEQIVIRDNSGFTDPIDLMDSRFAPMLTADPGGAKDTVVLNVIKDHRDNVMEYANKHRISGEEWGYRMFNAGIFVAHQTRDGQRRVMHTIGSQTDEYQFTIRSPKIKLMQKFGKDSKK